MKFHTIISVNYVACCDYCVSCVSEMHTVSIASFAHLVLFSCPKGPQLI